MKRSRTIPGAKIAPFVRIGLAGSEANDISQSIAQELADAILAGRADERQKWDGVGRVRLLIGDVLPEGSAVKETLGGRRKRLREAVAALLGAAGWKMVKANVFEKLGAA